MFEILFGINSILIIIDLIETVAIARAVVRASRNPHPCSLSLAAVLFLSSRKYSSVRIYRYSSAYNNAVVCKVFIDRLGRGRLENTMRYIIILCAYEIPRSPTADAPAAGGDDGRPFAEDEVFIFSTRVGRIHIKYYILICVYLCVYNTI